jgi:hypothetical protein
MAFWCLLFRRLYFGNVNDTKILHEDSAAELGREYGGRFALVDGTVQMRVCPIGVGTGGDSVEGSRESAPIHEVPPVRPEVLAQGLERRTHAARAARIGNELK